MLFGRQMGSEGARTGTELKFEFQDGEKGASVEKSDRDSSVDDEDTYDPD